MTRANPIRADIDARYTTTVKVCNRDGRLDAPRWVDTPTITAGEARAHLDAAALDHPDRQSKLNPAMTRAHAIEIMRKALAGKADDEPIRHMIAKNVLRLRLKVRRLPDRCWEQA